MKSWQTTLAGAIGALGVYLSTLTGWEHAIGVVLQAIGTALLGWFSASQTHVDSVTK